MAMKSIGGALLLAWMLLAVPTALAQEQCRLPALIEAKPCPNLGREEMRGRKGDFEYYILSFSWSPAFCAGPAGRRAALQCRDNSFGWVLHGLWPQYAERRAGQSWPQYCGPVQPVPEAILRRHLCVSPDPRLMQCEWAKHGSCSDFATPEEYFAAQARIAAALVLPAPQPGQSTEAFRSVVVAANMNRGLQPRNLRVVGGSEGIRELRVCLERDLQSYRAC
jgi:ribonuclease T2